MNDKITNCSRPAPVLEVKDAEINKHLPKPQSHNRHRQKTVNETTDGWAIAEEGSRKSSK